MTTNSDYLAKRQKMYPPRYPVLQGSDRAQQLYHILTGVLPPHMHDLFSNDFVAVGEIGLNTPDVQTIPIRGGSYVIEFNSGMMDFVYAVARGLVGGSVLNTQSGPQTHTALARTEVERQIAQLFFQWKWYRRWLWKLRRIQYPEFDIGEGLHQWAEDIATAAELFMLAHEMGHIVMEKEIVPPLAANVEQNADTIGLMLVANVSTKKSKDPTVIFAGAVFATRIFAGLEKVGVRFSSAYPPQAERIANMNACMLSLCPSRQYFHEISRISVAYQDMMDSVENNIVKQPGPTKPDSERMTVRLIAQLLEVVLGRIPKEILISDIIKIAKETPADIMQQIIDTFDKYYVTSPQDETFIDQDTKKKMGALIIEILPELSEDVRGMFKKSHRLR